MTILPTSNLLMSSLFACRHRGFRLWDTYFCTLLASEASKELAYSNLIEITRPTVRGNVPGFRTAGTTVSDRSKPYVGAFITLAHYNRFGDQWIVELL